MARLCAALKAEQDKTVSLSIADLVSGRKPDPFERLSVLDGHQILKPLPIQQDGTVRGTGRGGSTSVMVDGAEVSKIRYAAMGAIQRANYAKRHPTIQSNARARKMLDEKLADLEQAIKPLLSTGPANQIVFTKVANSTVTLIAFLQTEKLLDDEDKQM